MTGQDRSMADRRDAFFNKDDSGEQIIIGDMRWWGDPSGCCNTCGGVDDKGGEDKGEPYGEESWQDCTMESNWGWPCMWICFGICISGVGFTFSASATCSLSSNVCFVWVIVGCEVDILWSLENTESWSPSRCLIASTMVSRLRLDIEQETMVPTAVWEFPLSLFSFTIAS